MRYAIILAALFVLGCETVENHYYYGSDASGDVAADATGTGSDPYGPQCYEDDDCRTACVPRSIGGIPSVCSAPFCLGGGCGWTPTDVPCAVDSDCLR